MWWECSACGDHVERTRAPAVCGGCGMAGVIFVQVESDDPMAASPDGDSLRTMWLRAGFDHPELVMSA